MPETNRKSRKARDKTRVSKPRAGTARVTPNAAALPPGLDRRRHLVRRMPAIPGRLGGR